MPIYLRITVNRESVHKSTRHWILPKQWDSKTQMVKSDHDYHKEINLDITNRKREAFADIVNASIGNTAITARRVKENLDPEATNIFEVCEKVKKALAGSRSVNTFGIWATHLRKLADYAGEKVYLEQITPDFLSKFDQWLRSNVNHRAGKDPASYVVAIMRTIRKLFKEAIRRDLIEKKAYPFKDEEDANGYEMPRQDTGNKDHLSLPELDRWEKFIEETENEKYRQTAIYFLFGCYTGLRISDWKKFSFKQLHKDYLSLRATKNKAWVAIPVHPRLKRVLDRMKETPLTNKERTMSDHFKAIARECGIEKNVSAHVSRKTFAVTMCLEMGVPSETAAAFMGITLNVFVMSYSRLTPEKIRKDTAVWNTL